MAGSLTASPSTRRYVRYALYALCGALLLWLLRARGGPDQGGLAPAFDLPVVAAQAASATRVSLAEQRGKPLLIEVFASWCGSCRRAAPLLASAHQRYGSDVEFLGISVDEQPEAVARAKRSWQIPYTVLHDDTGAFARSYRIRVLPTFVLLDREGRIREVSSGTPGTRQLDRWLASVSE